MAQYRIMTAIGSSSWPVSPDAEEVDVMTLFRVNNRKDGEGAPERIVVRITRNDALGRLVMEMTGDDLRVARELLAKAAVETANYLDRQDPGAPRAGSDPRETVASLEFVSGHVRVSVTLAPPPPGGGVMQQAITLRCRGYALRLPHCDCLA